MTDKLDPSHGTFPETPSGAADATQPHTPLDPPPPRSLWTDTHDALLNVLGSDTGIRLAVDDREMHILRCGDLIIYADAMVGVMTRWQRISERDRHEAAEKARAEAAQKHAARIAELKAEAQRVLRRSVGIALAAGVLAGGIGWELFRLTHDAVKKTSPDRIEASAPSPP